MGHVQGITELMGLSGVSDNVVGEKGGEVNRSEIIARLVGHSNS